MAKKRGRKKTTRTQKVVRYVKQNKHVNRGLTKAKKIAIDEKHTLASAGAAFALGAMEHKNIKLPHIKQLGVEGTYGFLALYFGRQTNNAILRHLATGLLSVAAYKMGNELMKKTEVRGYEPDLEGYGVETDEEDYPIVSGTI
ncbi:MAG: hypothetical protein DRH04_06020 [Deltaproteobacteria bacterium]|nr:MAG: hypothetical protein DRH04_06020 [Deltaproteobacteria bacterium]